MSDFPTPNPITRRRLLVASSATLAAGAPLALAACERSDDDDVSSPAREAQLLDEVLAGQLAVLAAIEPTANSAPQPAATILPELEALRRDSVAALGAYITELDEVPTDEPAALVTAESPTEGAARQVEESIAVALAAIGELTSDPYRVAVHRAISEDAAALAVLRDVLGEDASPDAFVMGPSRAREKAK